jgi:hypothetical protein
MATELPKLLACPKCNNTENLERRSIVDVYDCGLLQEDGYFDFDDMKPLNIVYETQEPTNEFWCGECEIPLVMKSNGFGTFKLFIH